MKFYVPYVITASSLLMSILPSSDISGRTTADTDNIKKTIVNNTAKTIDVQPIDTVATQMVPYVISVATENRNVTYTMNNGERFTRRGGTLAWRNNNPGCIRYSEYAREMGALGKSGGFAVFPDEETGMHALEQLLRSENYINLTIAQAITKYAPPHENDTEAYKRRLSKLTGLPITTRLADLNAEQMQRVVKTIRKLEGWVPGKEIKIANDTAMQNVYAQQQNSLKIQMLKNSRTI